MTNVVPFTKQVSGVSKFAPEMTQWFKDQGVPDSIAELFLSIAHDRVRDTVTDLNFELLTYGVTKLEEKNQLRLYLDSDLRKKLVPEFGTQAHKTFFQLIVMPYTEGVHTTGFRHVMQEACDYFNNYPEVTASFTSLCYILLEAIMHNKQFQFLKLDMTDQDMFKDLFSFGFTTVARDHIYLVMIDFLPMLLDSAALEFYTEKLAADTGE